MHRVDVVALVLSAGLLLLVVELVRRRALREQYALLWLLASVVLIGLSLWRGALEALARLLGIFYAPSALLLVGMAALLLILLHFSLVVSKLSEENKELAQRYALMERHTGELEERLRAYMKHEMDAYVTPWLDGYRKPEAGGYRPAEADDYLKAEVDAQGRAG